MALALFDLDNTLLNGDSDHSWGLYLVEIGAVDKQEHQGKQDYFYAQYQAGTLDIYEFAEFQFEVFTRYPIKQLEAWRTDFLHDVIQPMIDTGKGALVEKHRRAGDKLVIITATNDFITAPIAEKFGVPTLIATQAERVNDQFTGKISGTPCFQQGKVTRLQEWLSETNRTLENSYFYSDSINDLPLLKSVDHPVVVTPDNKLRVKAKNLHWPIID